jgi:hypothetical protein
MRGCAHFDNSFSGPPAHLFLADLRARARKKAFDCADTPLKTLAAFLGVTWHSAGPIKAVFWRVSRWRRIELAVVRISVDPRRNALCPANDPVGHSGGSPIGANLQPQPCLRITWRNGS